VEGGSAPFFIKQDFESETDKKALQMRRHRMLFATERIFGNDKCNMTHCRGSATGWRELKGAKSRPPSLSENQSRSAKRFRPN
tara:strand:+ start:406 stop:654 length:249 start_codon:yes stop_codon:yes gene_type:complete